MVAYLPGYCFLEDKIMKLLFKVCVVLLIIAVLAYLAANFLLELWWFRSLNLGSYFIFRESYEWLVKFGTSILLTCLVYVNFAYIPRALSLHNGVDNKGLLAFLQKHKIILWLTSLVLVIPILIPVYQNWESFLLYYFSAKSELLDPAYGKNISYYFFSYPVYLLVQQELLWVFALLLALVGLLYFVFYRKHKDQLEGFPAAAKLHIAKLVAIIIILQAWSIALERIGMLYEDRHLPIFYGPGFVEMNFYLPLIWLSFLLFLGAAISTVYTIYTGKKRKLVIGFALAYLVTLGIKQLDFIPNMIDEYYVSSNPVAAESRYIQRHIKATSDAFNFADIKQIDYELESSLSPLQKKEIRQELDNIPLWDDNLIQPVYEQLQSIRPYYSFYEVAVDRYQLGGRDVQVNLAARELDFQNLATEAQNWRNRHLVFTHGFGMVMTAANQLANQPMQWLMHNFGQEAQFDKLKLKQPEIYYGLADYPYAIVPNTEAVLSEVSTMGDVNSDYKGSGGLPLSSFFIKAVVSAFFKDERIFFSAGINKQSRVLVRRNIMKRIKAIAPFLTLDTDPYPVLINQHLYWIVDAYTSSDRYPLVESMVLTGSTERKKFNYARNSVKIIIDAYNGSVDFYVVDQQDPVINTYRNLYPGLFKEVAEMPKAIIKHLSYPKAWFTLQMNLYARFHQTDPEVFYQQSQALELARMDEKPVEPYFLTLDIDEHTDVLPEDQEKFVLVSPLSPLGRENLNSIAIAGCLGAKHCKEHYQDDIYIYQFSKRIQVEGPAQINALTNQNPDISRQFTLWNQRGSKIIRGRIIIVPIEHALLYIQPLYIAATSVHGFPSLAKVLVSMNRHTAMADSVSGAFEQLLSQVPVTQDSQPSGVTYRPD